MTEYLCIPPARRNGPRESVKENIEEAETRYMLDLLRTKVEDATSKLVDCDAAVDASSRTIIDNLSAGTADMERL